jgi:hypothetical protein
MPTLDLADVYTSQFLKMCTQNGIVSEPTPAYRPELHGIAERWNKTIMTMANSMMYQARISPVLWSSAVAHANVIRNHLPTRSRGGHTPYELFTNRRPSYDNFKIWGSYCYKLIPNCKKIPGLAVRKRLIYVGDSPDSIGFRCYDPVEFKFSTEYDLIFDEASVKRRSVMLEAYDDRRNKIQDGRLDEIPLIANLDRNNELERHVFIPSVNTDGKDKVNQTTAGGGAHYQLQPYQLHADLEILPTVLIQRGTT